MENRRLIRPSIETYRRRGSGSARHQEPAGPGHDRERERDRDRGHDRDRERPGPVRRPSPPDQTHAEAYYYVKQMTAATPLVVVLDNGEELLGQIDWYDQRCIHLRRPNGSNILVFKEAIKYVYKLEELDAERAARYPEA